MGPLEIAKELFPPCSVEQPHSRLLLVADCQSGLHGLLCQLMSPGQMSAVCSGVGLLRKDLVTQVRLFVKPCDLACHFLFVILMEGNGKHIDMRSVIVQPIA